MRRATSSEAYIKNMKSGLIKGLRRKIYMALNEFPDSTGNEIANLREFSTYQIDSVRPRFAEMEAAGLIRVTGERECSISKSKAVTWDITDHVYTKEDVKRKRTEQKDLQKEVKQLEKENADLMKENQELKEIAIRAVDELEKFKSSGRLFWLVKQERHIHGFDGQNHSAAKQMFDEKEKMRLGPELILVREDTSGMSPRAVKAHVVKRE